MPAVEPEYSEMFHARHISLYFSIDKGRLSEVTLRSRLMQGPRPAKLHVAQASIELTGAHANASSIEVSCLTRFVTQLHSSHNYNTKAAKQENVSNSFKNIPDYTEDV